MKQELMFQKRSLSEKQTRLLEFIRHFQQEHGYPPTIRDMVRGCGLSSTSVAEYNLRILERGGYIRRDREVSRGIGLLEGGGNVPLLGVIAAGSPIPVPQADSWQATPWEQIEAPLRFVSGREGVFALRVKGDSMLDALVADGDIVLLQAATTAQEGDIVAAWLKDRGEITLKKFYREGRRVRLQPAHSGMAPIFVQAKDVEIQGKVIGVLRQLETRILREQGLREKRQSPRKHKKFVAKISNWHKTPTMKYMEEKYGVVIEEVLVSGSLSTIVKRLGNEIDRSTASKWRKAFNLKYKERP